jgi:hypothetical protein
MQGSCHLSESFLFGLNSKRRPTITGTLEPSYRRFRESGLACFLDSCTAGDAGAVVFLPRLLTHHTTGGEAMKLHVRHVLLTPDNEFTDSDYMDCAFCGRVFPAWEPFAFLTVRYDRNECLDEAGEVASESAGVACRECAGSNLKHMRVVLRNRISILVNRPEENSLEYLSDTFELLASIEEVLHEPSHIVCKPNPGFVYLVGSPDGYCKIGRAKEIHARIAAINLQLPFRVELIHSIETSDMVWAERWLHKKYAHCRMNGEWFLLTAEDINWIKSLTRLEQSHTEA